jgi:hypothetical protein
MVVCQAWDQSGTGLIINERLINCPPQLAPPLVQALFSEIKWATEDEPTQVGGTGCCRQGAGTLCIHTAPCAFGAVWWEPAAGVVHLVQFGGSRLPAWFIWCSLVGAGCRRGSFGAVWWEPRLPVWFLLSSVSFCDQPQKVSHNGHWALALILVGGATVVVSERVQV